MLRDRSKQQAYGAIIVASFVPRLVFGVLRPPTPRTNVYWRLAENLRDHGVLGLDATPSSYWDSLYPLFLAFARVVAFDDLTGVLAVQAVVAAIGGIYLYELTLRSTRDEHTAAIAAGLYALYPYLIRQAAELGEVTLLTTLLIASLYHFARSAERGHRIACGVALGLALLTRMAAAPVLCAAIAILIAERHAARALVVATVAAAVVVPYLIRNHGIDGSFLPTRSGYMLLKGNSPYSDAVIPEYDVDVLDPYIFKVVAPGLGDAGELSERTVDRFYAARAAELMKADMSATVFRSLRKAAILFYPRLVPFQRIGPKTTIRFVENGGVVVENAVWRSSVEEIAYAISYTPILLLALPGIYLRRRNLGEDKLLLATIVCFAAVYAIYCPSTRVRSPIDFVPMFYAACTIRSMLGGSRHDALIWKNPNKA